jgi:hypothetical protein
MKKLTLITALLLAASPVAAQQALGAGGQTNNSPLPDTGIVCQQEMTATFCNVPTSPNIGGFGSSRGCPHRAQGQERAPGPGRAQEPEATLRPSRLAVAFRRLTNCATEQTTPKKKPRGNSGSSPDGDRGAWGDRRPRLEFRNAFSTSPSPSC